MKNNHDTSSSSDEAFLNAMTRSPEPLAQAAHLCLVELMSDLAEGKLSGESRAKAVEIRDSNEAARELYELFIDRPAPPLLSGETPSLALGPVREFLDGFANALRELYAGLALPAALAAREEEAEEQTIPVGNTTASLRRAKRPDGNYEIQLVVPASANIDPAALSRYVLKLVDRPEPLVFEKRRSGNLVAVVVLPHLIDKPEKQIVIEPLNPGTADDVPNLT